MDGFNERNAQFPQGNNPVPPAFNLPSTTRYDLILVALAVTTGFLGGIALSISWLSYAPPDVLPLLGVVLLIGATTALFVLRQRQATLLSAARGWQAHANARIGALVQRLAECDREHEIQRTQIQDLEAKLSALVATDPPLTIPLVLDYEMLGTDQREIATHVSILSQLFKGQREVRVTHKLQGGHRNRGVYVVGASDEVERIVKIARSEDIRAELGAQELINRFMQNNGGQIVRALHSAEGDALGGVVYRLTGLRRNVEVFTFGTFYEACTSPTDAVSVVEQLYGEVLPHSEFRELRDVPLFRDYALPERVLSKGWAAVKGLRGFDRVARDGEWGEFAFDGSTRRVMNPFFWAANIMPRYFGLSMPSVRGVIHGDLHSGNLLLQAPGPSLWIIDFAKTRADAHTLIDYARFEADLKFYLLKDSVENYLPQALTLEAMLLSPSGIADLDAPLANLQELGAEFQKAGASIAALRRVASSHQRRANEDVIGHFGDASVLPYCLALFYFTLRMLTYEQCSAAQKTYAFLAAALTCERITQLLT